MALELTNAGNMTLQKEDEKKEEKFVLDGTYKRVTALPSNFLAYPKDVEIYFKPLTTGEIERLNESELSLTLKIESDMNSIFVKGMDKYDLTKDDYAYIALMRKLYSQDEVLGVLNYRCEECQNMNRVEFNLKELEFTFPEVVKAPALIEVGGYWLKIGFMTVKGMLELAKLQETKSLQPSDTYAMMVQGVGTGIDINSITWREKTFDEIVKIIESAWGEEIEVLSTVDTMLYHGIKPMEVTCTQTPIQMVDSETQEVVESKVCGHKQMEDLGDIFALIFPKRRDRNYLRSKIFTL